MKALDLEMVRFGAEEELLTRIREDRGLRRAQNSLPKERSSADARLLLLADAVHVDALVLPELSRALDELDALQSDRVSIEAFVYQDPSIQAGVFEIGSSVFVRISSGAINELEMSEIKFLLGHELGHSVFGHTKFPSQALILSGKLRPYQSVMLRAWERASEISADRMGLVVCGSVDTATRALYRSQTGLRLGEVRLGPEVFARQIEHLLGDVVESPRGICWGLSHPFGPIRLRALELFSQSDLGAGGRSTMEVDGEIARLLEFMNPFPAWPRNGEEPLTSDLAFWGGLYVALADGRLTRSEARRILSVAPTDVDLASTVAGQTATEERCLREFAAARRGRSTSLRPLELHSIIEGLVLVAKADVVGLRCLYQFAC